MHLRTLDHEVGSGRARRVYLRPDTGIASTKRALAKARVITPYGSVESRFPRFIEGIVDAIDPREIGTEFNLTAEIDRHVHAEPVLARDGIDQTIERRLAAERVVMA